MLARVEHQDYKHADKEIDPTEYSAFLILHAAGHTTGYNHTNNAQEPPRPEGNMYTALIMVEGKTFDGWLSLGFVNVEKMIGGIKIFDKPANNKDYCKAIRSRYKNNMSKSKF